MTLSKAQKHSVRFIYVYLSSWPKPEPAFACGAAVVFWQTKVNGPQNSRTCCFFVMFYDLYKRNSVNDALYASLYYSVLKDWGYINWSYCICLVCLQVFTSQCFWQFFVVHQGKWIYIHTMCFVFNTQLCFLPASLQNSSVTSKPSPHSRG